MSTGWGRWPAGTAASTPRWRSRWSRPATARSGPPEPLTRQEIRPMSPVDTSPLHDRLAFARQVKAASDGELLALMQSPRRASIVQDIAVDLPAVFLAERAGDLEAVVHWRITGRPDG